MGRLDTPGRIQGLADHLALQPVKSAHLDKLERLPETTRCRAARRQDPIGAMFSPGPTNRQRAACAAVISSRSANTTKSLAARPALVTTGMVSIAM
jgi:hypothetical protein